MVGEFDDEERRRFLKFFTGSDRAPIGGLGNLRCARTRLIWLFVSEPSRQTWAVAPCLLVHRSICMQPSPKAR